MGICDKQQYGEQDQTDAVFQEVVVKFLHIVVHNRAGNICLKYIVRVAHRIIQRVIQVGHNTKCIEEYHCAHDDRCNTKDLLHCQLFFVHDDLHHLLSNGFIRAGRL